MFKVMTADDRSYHAGASEDARIIDNEDFPVVIVVDQSRVEIYWVDNDLDTHNYYFIHYLAFDIAEMVAASIEFWINKNNGPNLIQSKLEVILPSLGFVKI